MFRPVGLAARPSGSSPGSCCSGPSAARVWASISPKISSAIPTMLSECVDAVVVVQEDRPDLQRLFHVAVATLNDLLVFVEPQDLAGGDPAGEVRRERVDPVEARGCGDRVLVALPGKVSFPSRGW